MKRNNFFEKGLTLIELLVGIFIFSIVFGAASGVFVSAIRNQNRALASQLLLSQTSYLMEYTGRAIRMARKQLPPMPECSVTCLSQNGLNYEIQGESDLRFQNYNCVCQRFFLDGGQLKEGKGWELVGGTPTGGTTQPLISNNLQIDFLKFNLSGQSQADTLQPRVTMFLEIRKAGSGPQPKIKIQTTISQRRLDILE